VPPWREEPPDKRETIMFDKRETIMFNACDPGGSVAVSAWVNVSCGPYGKVVTNNSATYNPDIIEYRFPVKGAGLYSLSARYASHLDNRPVKIFVNDIEIATYALGRPNAKCWYEQCVPEEFEYVDGELYLREGENTFRVENNLLERPPYGPVWVPIPHLREFRFAPQ
jgi:hypothetical protein